MSKRNSWKIATAATMLAVMLSLSTNISAQSYPARTTVSPQPGEQITLKEQARLWANELSSSEDESFRKWQGAWMSTTPLGPGTHSWLVLLKQSQTIVGYMIIHAKEDSAGYVLGEYGIGEYPPFSAQSLKSSLEKLGLAGAGTSMQARRVYVNPLQAAWQVTGVGPAVPGAETRYTDAYSGEELPVDYAGWTSLSDDAENVNKHGLQLAHASILTYSAIPAFDPYGRLPWLTSSPYSISSDPARWIQSAFGRGEQLRFVSVAFHGRMKYVWSVSGYSEWSSGELFVGLSSEENSEERRYIPVSLLGSAGQFYR